MSCDEPGSASATGPGMRFFFSDRGKIVILLELRRGNCGESAQNLESKEVAGKILRNKELAAQFGLGGGASNWIWIAGTNQLSAFYWLGQGCTSQSASFLLCKAVENPNEELQVWERPGLG